MSRICDPECYQGCSNTAIWKKLLLTVFKAATYRETRSIISHSTFNSGNRFMDAIPHYSYFFLNSWLKTWRATNKKNLKMIPSKLKAIPKSISKAINSRTRRRRTEISSISGIIFGQKFCVFFLSVHDLCTCLQFPFSINFPAHHPVKPHFHSFTCSLDNKTLNNKVKPSIPTSFKV